ncbi:juvenile hormone esterase-like [Epargyreus clarus]|uniref:juvenile hormone esterase-like n=1 Tax=Epargyreus clarus TaxID=520877 RepID=UPI003C2DE43C
MAVVQVEQGALKGIECNYNGEQYVAFKGIPYATPPLGVLRFKAPKPPEPWQGIRDASEHGPVCPQYNERLYRIDPGSEDCLYLNVYTKAINPPQPLPVMVWIHGGGFYTGSGNSDFYGPEFFMKHDVILVTFNYRLEVLGFLCLDTEEVPGNAGLKDQVAALRWVKNNITAFGGDSNNITIFGCSAGAASTSYHLVSKMSEGLFNKAICQSGVCLNEWGYNIYGKERAFQLGKILGITTDSPNELLQFLRDMPVSSLIKIQLPILGKQHEDLADSIFFGPVIEKEHLNIEKFITEEPTNLIKNGKLANVPIMVGYTSAEGIEIGKRLAGIAGFLSMKGAVVPRELKLKWAPEKILEIDKKIRNYYFQDKEITPAILQEYVNFETDRLFAYNIVRFARYHVKNTSPVYLYKFTAETERNFTKKYYNMQEVAGVCHSDELPYLFNVTCINIPLTDVSRSIIKSIVDLWVNFASTGNPTSPNHEVQWKQFTNVERNCYVIDYECKCVPNINEENMKFWEEIYDESNL